jgi:hypothetical protein
MATTHRQVQRQHLAAVAMHSAHAARLQAWADTPARQTALPRFMGSVAEVAQADSAAVTLFGPGLTETLSSASDGIAKAAQDAEFTLGEGPARDAVTCRHTIRARASICQRWPNYGPTVAGLGIRSIAAVPIVPARSEPIGALALFGLRPHSPPDDLDGLRAVADTITSMLLDETSTNDTMDEAVHRPLMADGDHRPVVHQAAGIVSVQCDCTIPDALAMIRARAFTKDEPLEAVATAIVNRTLRLT